MASSRMLATNRPVQFAWSDAWVLLAIIYGGGKVGADIQTILSAADFINHAIPTFDELDGALARLHSASYIEKLGARYRATRIVLSAHAKSRRRFVYKALDDIESFLGIEKFTASTSVPSAVNRRGGLSRRAYENAVKKNFQELHDKARSYMPNRR